MELTVLFWVLLLPAAVKGSSTSGVTAVASEAKVERITCQKKDRTTQSGDKVAYATLNISENLPLSGTQRLASIHWEGNAQRDRVTSTGVAVRGKLEGFNDESYSAFLEILFREIPLIEGLDTDRFECQYTHSDDKKDREKAKVTKEDVRVFVCDAGENKNIASMSLIERRGAVDAVVGPVTTRPSEGMQYWNSTPAEPLILFNRSESKLVVFRSRNSRSSNDVQYFCRVEFSDKTVTLQDFLSKPEAGREFQQSEKQTGEPAAENTYTWVGYPVIVGVLVAVIIGAVVMVVIRKRRSRDRTPTTGCEERLVGNPSESSVTSKV